MRFIFLKRHRVVSLIIILSLAITTTAFAGLMFLDSTLTVTSEDYDNPIILPILTDYTLTRVRAISDSRLIVGLAARVSGEPTEQAVLLSWASGVDYSITTLPVLASYTRNDARGFAKDNLPVGFSYAGTDRKATVWSGGTAFELAMPDGFDRSQAIGGSGTTGMAAGEVYHSSETVVCGAGSLAKRHAVVWDVADDGSSTVCDLDMPVGACTSSAVDVNASGVVSGTVTSVVESVFHTNAAVWRPTGTPCDYEVTTFPDYESYTSHVLPHINDSGDVVARAQVSGMLPVGLYWKWNGTTYNNPVVLDIPSNTSPPTAYPSVYGLDINNNGIISGVTQYRATSTGGATVASLVTVWENLSPTLLGSNSDLLTGEGINNSGDVIGSAVSTDNAQVWLYNPIIGGSSVFVTGNINLSLVISGGSLSPDSVKMYIGGEQAPSGTYTRTYGRYQISADPVPNYALTYVGDCAPSGSLDLSSSTATCTVSFTYIPTPTPSITPPPEVFNTPFVIPSISPSPTTSPTSSPSPSPIPTPSASVSPSPSVSVIPLPSVSVPPLSSTDIPSSPTGESEPSSFIESVSSVVSNITEATTEEVVPVAAPALTAVISIPILISGASAAASSGAPASFALSELRHLLEVVGLKRKRRVWGVIYDSKTKKPIPYAKVELKDQSNRTLETRFADRSGRYGFLTSASSLHQKAVQYHLDPSSPKYAFPSQIVTSDPDFIVYDHIYKGEPLTTTKGTLVNYNIPLDPKAKQAPIPTISKPLISRSASSLLNVGFWIGVVAAPLNAYLNPSTYSVSVLVVFALMNTIRISSDLYRPFGLVYDSKTHKPLSYALVTLNDSKGNRKAFSVSDEQGRYFLLTDPGSYTLTIHTPAHISPSRSKSVDLKAKKGWIRDKVVV